MPTYLGKAKQGSQSAASAAAWVGSVVARTTVSRSIDPSSPRSPDNVAARSLGGIAACCMKADHSAAPNVPGKAGSWAARSWKLRKSRRSSAGGRVARSSSRVDGRLLVEAPMLSRRHAERARPASRAGAKSDDTPDDQVISVIELVRPKILQYKRPSTTVTRHPFTEAHTKDRSTKHSVAHGHM